MMKCSLHSLPQQGVYRVTIRSSTRRAPSFLLPTQVQSFKKPLLSSNHAFSAPSYSSSSSSSTKPWNQFVSWYAEKLDTHPFLTKGITCGIIAGMGDLMCQAVVHEDSTDGEKHWWDKRRTARFVILGTLLVAPSIHVWYGALAQHQQSFSLFQRVLMDQVLFCPSFLVVWLVGLWKLEELDPNYSVAGEHNKRLQTYTERLVDAVPNLVVANWILWFPAQAINFGFVPVKFQVLFSNLVSLLWNGYLSFSTSSSSSSSNAVSPPEEPVSNPTGLRGRNSRISLS